MSEKKKLVNEKVKEEEKGESLRIDIKVLLMILGKKCKKVWKRKSAVWGCQQQQTEGRIKENGNTLVQVGGWVETVFTMRLSGCTGDRWYTSKHGPNFLMCRYLIQKNQNDPLTGTTG